ncbi:MAG: hypothetical protein PF517_09090 [Salinivirgaceae bacterium]|nr:hypothetical protein [Salinivirgaceae bacterium]
MFKRSIIWVFLLFVFAFSESVSSQSFVADTVNVKFLPDTAFSLNHTLSATDFREEEPHLISIYEKKKFLFFPVDQIVLTEKPIAKEFAYHLSKNKGRKLQLDIHDFYVDQSNSMFNRSYNLSAAFQLSQIQTAGDTNLLGVFYYDNTTKFKKKKPVEEGYNEVINSFKSEFIGDINAVCSDTAKVFISGQNHFRKGQKVAAKNFYISSDVYYGYTFWGFDAEIYFSSPEPGQKFKRKSKMFRFLHYENRQSVAFAASVSNFNYRINEKWLFQNKTAFLLGFNKWNDIDESNRTLQELFLMQCSIMQRITMNHLDKKGFTFGFGLMEEGSFIVYNDLMFNVAVVLNCAYKF